MLVCQKLSSEIDRSSDDDDLQSLEWLQNFDITRITNFLDAGLDSSKKDPKSEISDHQDVESGSGSGQKRKPLQCTFSCMVFRAIEESPHRALPLQSIYGWIEERYPYFARSGSQWKNSVRHSLSLNQCFIRLKVGAEDSNDRSSVNMGVGSWWTVHPDFRRAYGPSVLAQGAAHSCLPRGVSGSGPKRNSVTRLSTSEHELAVLANDIKAAATILALKEPLGVSNRSRSTDGQKRKNSDKASPLKKRKLDHEYVVSRGLDEDHRYISENAKRSFTISSLIDSSDQNRSKEESSKKKTADACVQVCASDFELEINNRRFVRVRNAKPTVRDCGKCKK